MNIGLNMELKINNLSVSNDIIPIGEFKTSLSEWLKNVI